MSPPAREQPGADQHVIAAIPEADRQALRRHRGFQRVLHPAGGHLGAFVGAGHGHVGLGIEGVARRHQALQHLGGIGVEEHRPVLPPRHAAQQGGEFASQPERGGAARLDRSAGRGIGEGTAAGRENQRRPGQQAGDDAALAGAEMRFAVAGEDLRDGHAGGRFDLGIRVAEGQAEPRREPLADRRLAGAGHADEHHRAHRARRCGLGRWGQRVVVFGKIDGGVARHGAGG
jgi:hypothetical protein